jgi:phosphoribosyl 1,2-cyclic phosphodiesterase
VRIWVCGVRGSTPAPGTAFFRYGGHTACLAFAHDGEPPSLIVDAGTGIRRIGDFFSHDTIFGSAPFSGTILLSHLHFAHTQGLPFFGAGNHPDARVDLFAPPEGDCEESIARFMSPPFFPIAPSGLRGSWQFNTLEAGELKLDGFSIAVRDLPHSDSRTFGFRISDGGSSVAYLADHAPTRLGPGPDGVGEYHSDAVSLAKGCALLVHDAEYSDAELANRENARHSSSRYAVALAENAAASRVLLTHHHPDRTDDELDAIVDRHRRAPMRVEAAAVGTVLDL